MAFVKHFLFEISNQFQDQQFLCEAEDLIGAHMKGVEFARQIDEFLGAKYGVNVASKLNFVADTNALFANGEGFEEYHQSVKELCQDQEEDD